MPSVRGHGGPSLAQCRLGMMLPSSVQVWMATEPVDMRRGHDGLLALVRALGAADPYSGHLFVFLGRRSDRRKILYWHRGGFVVTYKAMIAELRAVVAEMRLLLEQMRVASAARDAELDALKRKAFGK